MSSHTRRLRRRATATVIAAALCAPAAAAAADSISAEWLNAVSGNWTDASKWSTSPEYPDNSGESTTYDAIIAAAGSPYTVTFSGVVFIGGLTLNASVATLRQSSGSLALTEGLQLLAGTYRLAGGSLHTSVIAGGGIFTFDGNNAGSQFLHAYGGTLTVGSDVTIRTQLGSGTIGSSGEHIVNNGTIVAQSGRSVTMRGNWVNNGTLRLEGGSFNIKDPITTSNLGAFVNTSPATGWINLDSTLNNAGATLTLDSTTGPIYLGSNGSIVGGTISGSGGTAVIVSTGGGPTVDAVTVSNEGLAVHSSGTLRVRNGLTLSPGAVISMGQSGSSQANLHFDGTQTLGGNGEIHMNGSGAIRGTAGTLTIGPGVTVRARGFSNSIGDSARPLVNHGVFATEGANSFFSVNASSFANSGTINIAIGSSTIENLQNTGSVNITGGTTLLHGAWHNAGAINVSNGTLNLGGTFTAASIGTLNRTGGNVNLTGTLNLAGATLALNASTGNWGLGNGGRIKDGSLTTSGGATLTFGGGTLDNVAVAAAITLPYSNIVNVENGLTFTGGGSFTISAPQFNFDTKMIFNGTQTLGGTGEILLSGPYGKMTPSSGTLTIGPNITIRSTGTNSGGTVGANGVPLINQGMIWSASSGGSIDVRGSTITNTGTIKSSAGARLSFNATHLDNQGTIEAAGNVFTLGGQTWRNSGTITTAAAQSFLYGTFALADLGNFTRTGGNLTINGNLINTASTLNLATAFNGPVTLTGTVTGGTVVTTAAAPLLISNGKLDAVALEGDATVGDGFGSSSLRIANGLHLPAGRKILFSAGGGLSAEGTQSLTGAGELHFTAAGDAITGGTLTIDPVITVKTVGSSSSAAVTANVINNGTFWLNSSAGHLSLDGNFINNGVIRVDAGMLNLGGTDWQNEWGTVVRNGGTINYIGKLNNTGTIFDLATTPVGRVNLGTGAGITGGTITNSGVGTAEIVRSSSFNPIDVTLVGVTIACSMNVRDSQLSVWNSLALSGNPNLRILGSNLSTIGLQLVGPGSITGEGVISFETSGSAQASVRTLAGALTIGPDVTIRNVSSTFSSVRAPGSIVNQGIISAQASGKNLSVDNSLSNLGLVEARNGGKLYIYFFAPATLSNNILGSGKWRVFAGSTLDFNARTFTTNNASILLDGVGSTFAAVAPLNNNAGTFEIDHGRNFSTVGSLTNSGTLRVGQSSTLTVNGTLTNTGKIKGKGTIVAANVTSSGAIEPGESPGTLSFTGNLALLPDSLLEIEIGGVGGALSDLLKVSGQLSLGGTLKLTLLDDFVPGPNQPLVFLNAGSLTGQFHHLILPPLPNGMHWDESALLSGGPATAVPEPTALSLFVLVISACAGRRSRR